MRKALLIFIITIVLISLIPSCKLEPIDENSSINHNIFPYVKFTLSEDGKYYTASILEGASVANIYIPAEVADSRSQTGAFPVKVFTGFENDEDIVNLTNTTFESSITKIELKSLDQAALLSTLKYNTVEQENTRWSNLPQLPDTEDEEFVGWFLQDNKDVRIKNGDIMVPGYTTLFPKWGTHTFKEVEAQEATCTESGWEAYHYCTNTGCDYTTKVEIPALGHSLTKHEKVDSTCITVGYKQDCYECTRCKLFFLDENATEQIDKTTVIIPNSGHASDGKIYGQDDDTYHWYICKVCKEEYNKVEHTYGPWYDFGDGIHRAQECTVCFHVNKTEKEHIWNKVDETNSTCTVKGHLEYWYCSKHPGEYALSKNPSDDQILTKEQLDNKVDKDLLPHDLSDWITTDPEKHWKECSICKNKFETAEHTFEYIFTQDGERNFTVKRNCTVCGATGENKSEHKSMFDISASFGNVKIEKTSSKTWTLSYYGTCSSCYWAKENGERILEDADPFTINYVTEGQGEFKVFCYAYNSKGELIEIAFALLTAN